jgi:hypothetical protein
MFVTWQLPICLWLINHLFYDLSIYNNNTVLSLDQNGLSIPSYQPLISSSNKINASLINNLSSAISNAYIPNNTTYTLPGTHPGQVAYGVTNTNGGNWVLFKNNPSTGKISQFCDGNIYCDGSIYLTNNGNYCI